ncbi:diguanylate cyclase domain-containing protein [Alteromonas flava]|uniref:diguanylate cyclase domain-containing protein n=1 Tax=Alteromonas flava TaxID=2048003 RepID=UPI000C2852D3|nr:diguanylate cyclase [Alteromonas flava]
MKRDIDILLVINDQENADSLCRGIEPFIPGARLVTVQKIAHVLPVIFTYHVKLLVVAHEEHEVTESLTYSIAEAFPRTLLQLVPVSFLLCPKCAVTTFKLWAKYLQYVSVLPNKSPRRSVIHKEKAILAAMPEAVISCDNHGNMTYLNRAAEHLIGLKKCQMLDKPITSIVELGTEGERVESFPTLESLLSAESAHSRNFNANLINDSGEHTPVISSVSSLEDNLKRGNGAVMVMRKVDRSYMQLHHQANYDWLTDLPNRTLLMARLNLAVSLAIRHNYYVCLMFIDLDDFKGINDTMGHDAGDQLLKSVAQRLISCVRGSDTVSRHGGDEFVILLTEIIKIGDCERVARKILNAFRFPHKVGGKPCVIGLSIGISIFPSDADCSHTMYLHADKAMYAAKTGGRNKFVVYDGS